MAWPLSFVNSQRPPHQSPDAVAAWAYPNGHTARLWVRRRSCMSRPCWLLGGANGGIRAMQVIQLGASQMCGELLGKPSALTDADNGSLAHLKDEARPPILGTQLKRNKHTRVITGATGKSSKSLILKSFLVDPPDQDWPLRAYRRSQEIKDLHPAKLLRREARTGSKTEGACWEPLKQRFRRALCVWLPP